MPFKTVCFKRIKRHSTCWAVVLVGPTDAGLKKLTLQGLWRICVVRDPTVNVTATQGTQWVRIV